MSIPAGATHVVADIYGLSDSGKSMNERYPYRKKDSAGWFAYVEGEWVGVVFGDPSRYRRIDKPWSGPEDGLPPVNTVCEVVEGTAYWDSRESEWLGSNVKVKAAFVNDLGQSIVAVERFDGRCSCFIIECLAVTKTPEQIASEKRETAIRELMDIAQVDCRVTAARLVDAGFKREVV